MLVRPNMEFSKKYTALIVIAILLLGAGVRAYRLDYQSLWNDEILTALRSNKDLTQVLARRNLYNLVVHPFFRLRHQDYIVRLPSMIFGSLTILLLYFVLSNWFGRTIGLIGAMIMAISPFHVWYSQEARTYALLLFLSLLSLWLLQQLMKGRKNYWVTLGFIFSTSATLYCHLVAIAFVGFLWVSVLILVPRQKWKNWLPVFGGIALLVTPKIYPLFVSTPSASEIQSQPINIFSIAYSIWVFVAGFSLGPTVAELHMPDRMKTTLGHIEIILPVMLFISAMFVWGALRLRYRDNRLFWLTALWFLFPLIFGVLGAVFTGFPLNPRYFILCFPPFIVFVITGVMSLRGIWVGRAAFAFIGLISLFSLSNYLFNERFHKDNNSAAGQFFTAQSKANDLIISSPVYTGKNLQYYYSGNHDLIFKGYPPAIRYVELSQLESGLKRIILDRERFWLFLSRTFHSDPKEAIRKYCDKHFRRDLHFSSSGVKLILYRTQ